MLLFSVLLFFAGLLLLYYGADSLVLGSSRLAVSFGIRPLVIGLTVVSFATSMPEFLVSLLAAMRGSGDLAAGNIIGSNIANIGLILGAAALLRPLEVSRSTLRREVPFMLAASLLLYGLSLDGWLDAGNGLLLFGLLLVFLLYCLLSARDRNAQAAGMDLDPELERRRRGRDLLLVVLGIAGLGVGAELMVRSAVTIARHFGVSELVIGMSIVALGTSLPELAASMVSAWKGEMDISVGNVIGSNIFNLLFVLGLCPMLRPLAMEPSLLRFELPVMLGFSFLLLPLVGHRLRVSRGKGGLLVALYLGFITTLFLWGR